MLDEESELYRHLNKEMVAMEKVENRYDIKELKGLIEEHTRYTGSPRGREILEHFEEYLPKFKKVIPFDYEKMQTFVLQMEEKGLSSEQAKIEAFYAIKNGKE